MEVIIMVLAIIGVMGGISGAIASSRGHSFLMFFLLGALISPLLAIILAFVITPPAQGRPVRSTRRFVRRAGATGTVDRAAARTRARSGNPYEAPGRPARRSRYG